MEADTKMETAAKMEADAKTETTAAAAETEADTKLEAAEKTETSAAETETSAAETETTAAKSEDAAVKPEAAAPVVKECPFTLLTFADPPPVVALEKLSMSNSAYDQEFKLNIEELSAIESLMRNPQCAVSDIHFTALERGLKWAVDDLPPIIHTLSVAFLNEAFNTGMCSSKRGSQVFERLANITVSDPKVNIAILIMRSFANMASHKAGCELLKKDVTLICDLALKHIQNANLKLQIASACVLANITLILWTSTEVEKVAELGPREDVVRSFINNFESNFNFELSQTALIILLQAIATSMWGDNSIITLSRNLFMQKYVDAIRDKVPDEAGKSLAREIVEMMHSVD